MFQNFNKLVMGLSALETTNAVDLDAFKKGGKLLGGKSVADETTTLDCSQWDGKYVEPSQDFIDLINNAVYSGDTTYYD